MPRGTAADLPALKRTRGWTDVVVKPAVGGSSRDTVHEARVGASAAGRHLRALSAREDTVVQPFVATVLEDGEISLVYLGGTFSHAVRKSAARGDWRVQSDFGGSAGSVDPPPHVRAAADAALDAGPAGVYARVDVLRQRRDGADHRARADRLARRTRRASTKYAGRGVPSGSTSPASKRAPGAAPNHW